MTKRNVAEIDDILALAIKEGAAALHLFMLVPVGCGVEIAETDMITSEKYEEVLNWFYDRSREVSIEFKATCAPHYYRIIRQRAKAEGRTLSFETDGMAAMTRGCLAVQAYAYFTQGETQPCGHLPLSAVMCRPGPEVRENLNSCNTRTQYVKKARRIVRAYGWCSGVLRGICWRRNLLSMSPERTEVIWISAAKKPESLTGR